MVRLWCWHCGRTCVIKSDTSLSLFAFQEKEAEDVYCFAHVLYEMFSGEPLRTSTLKDLPAHCPSQLSKYCILYRQNGNLIKAKAHTSQRPKRLEVIRVSLV